MKQLLYLFIFSAILWTINTVSEECGLFWLTWWADILAHFIGGTTVALGILWILKNVFKIKISLYKSIILVLLVGVFWECFEIYFYLINFEDKLDRIDSGFDLIVDSFGGLLGYYLFNKYEE